MKLAHPYLTSKGQGNQVHNLPDSWVCSASSAGQEKEGDYNIKMICAMSLVSA
jgi:hypothetical protein